EIKLQKQEQELKRCYEILEELKRKQEQEKRNLIKQKIPIDLIKECENLRKDFEEQRISRANLFFKTGDDNYDINKIQNKLSDCDKKIERWIDIYLEEKEQKQ